MDSHQLKAFIAVAESGSFSAAADRLYLTQPAVSKRIAALELILESRLFDRIGRRVILTEAGRLLLPRAYQVLAAIEDAQTAVLSQSERVSGVLDLVVSYHIGLYRVPPLLKEFNRQYPEVVLNLSFAESESAYNSILQGSIELGLITLAPHSDVSLHTEPVWSDELKFVVMPDHPLARLKRPNLKDLSTHNAILPGPTTFTHHIVKGLFSQHQLPLQMTIPTNYMEAIKMMVSIGLGWGVLPATMLDSSMHILPLQIPALPRPLGFVYHRNRTLSQAASAFMTLVKESGTS